MLESPVQLNTTKEFFEDTTLHNFINRQSYIFLSTDTTVFTTTGFDTSNIRVIAFSPVNMRLQVDNPGYRFITFLQNDYPWWETFVNGEKVMHFKGYRTFITLPLQNGKQEIEYRFDAAPVKKALWTNIAIIIVGLVLLVTKLRKQVIF